jgi:hypothetical protein
MNEVPYPDGYDCVWVASDHNGHVAVFITGGFGPMPSEVLMENYIPIHCIEDDILEMPVIGQARLFVDVPRPDSFVGLAKRGFFVYDWADCSRISSKRTRVYEIVATPSFPIDFCSLPDNLAELALTLNFTDLVFSECATVDVPAQTNCVAGRQYYE